VDNIVSDFPLSQGEHERIAQWVGKWLLKFRAATYMTEHVKWILKKYTVLIELMEQPG